jgi:hypothetical protein
MHGARMALPMHRHRERGVMLQRRHGKGRVSDLEPWGSPGKMSDGGTRHGGGVVGAPETKASAQALLALAVYQHCKLLFEDCRCSAPAGKDTVGIGESNLKYMRVPRIEANVDSGI